MRVFSPEMVAVVVAADRCAGGLRAERAVVFASIARAPRQRPSNRPLLNPECWIIPMDHFEYRNGRLCAEDVPVADIAATVGTPCYIYSRATIERHWRAFDRAFGDHPHLVCYAVKANSNLAVLNLLARLGSGFDIVSVGELERVLAAGGDPRQSRVFRRGQAPR
jgi:hypothetical protein